MMDYEFGLARWPSYANRAIEILTVTTTIEGHHPHHDKALADLRVLVKNGH